MKKNEERSISKKDKRTKLAVRILTLFLVAVMLAGSFYYTIVFIAGIFA